MEERKTVAERLREKPNGSSLECYEAVAVMGISCRDMESCMACYNKTAEMLADAIEQERSKTEHDGAIPDGIEWPRFEDGELVRFGDRFVDRDGVAKKVTDVHFYEDKVFVGPCDRYKYGEPVKRPEREVLDADGVPIKVGDTVYYTQPSAYTEGERIVDTIVGKEVCFTNGYWANPAHLTHRKPDSMESLWQDAEDFVNHLGDGRNATYVFTLLKRQSKLLGGE